MKIEVYPKSEFLERRKHGIGGSDIGAIMGVSVFKTALDVYCDKLGLVEQSEPSFAMRMGNRMESVIRDEYLLQNENEIYLDHTEDPDMKSIIVTDGIYYYHPDGIINEVFPHKYLHKVSPCNYIGLWEAKYSTRYDAWGMTAEEVPLEYQYQVQWGMMCSDLPYCDLSLIIGREYRQFRIKRDDKLIKQLKTAVDKFWNDYVLKSTPPPPSDKKSDEELLRALYADEGSTITADVEIVELADEFLGLKDEIGRLGDVQQGIRNKIEAKMQTANLCMSDYFKISWKQSKEKQKIDWETVAKELLEELEPDIHPMYKSFYQDTIAENTTTKQGSRPFLVKRLEK